MKDINLFNLYHKLKVASKKIQDGLQRSQAKLTIVDDWVKFTNDLSVNNFGMFELRHWQDVYSIARMYIPENRKQEIDCLVAAFARASAECNDDDEVKIVTQKINEFSVSLKTQEPVQ